MMKKNNNIKNNNIPNSSIFVRHGDGLLEVDENEKTYDFINHNISSMTREQMIDKLKQLPSNEIYYGITPAQIIQALEMKSKNKKEALKILNIKSVKNFDSAFKYWLPGQRWPKKKSSSSSLSDNSNETVNSETGAVNLEIEAVDSETGAVNSKIQIKSLINPENKDAKILDIEAEDFLNNVFRGYNM